MESMNDEDEIEPLWQRGEWAAQAELTWKSSTNLATGRSSSRRQVTYAVIHVPTQTRAEAFFTRPDARNLVRWLASKIPHPPITREGDVVTVGEGPVWNDLCEIMSMVRRGRHYGMTVTKLWRLMRMGTPWKEPL